ncbi:MAG: rRNA pseudouridine synthase [Deltaproteobacteria bacterium]|nr:rRNA pseudouridine synthase [Deltaproteobacteria bacterium]
MERLQKIIANAGIASRRKAEEMILESRVRLNGKIINSLGMKADLCVDIIEVDGKRLRPPQRSLYILLNKPKGVISSTSDPEGRPVVTDFVKKAAKSERVFPVGRLDFDAEGALLLTNDGCLCTRLIHPRRKIPKKYLVKVSDVPCDKDLKRLSEGVKLEDGMTMPAKARLVRTTKENSWIELIVVEGRNRLIKRMRARVGHSVAKLKRVEFAGLGVGGLKSGEWRFLVEKEVLQLKKLAGLESGKQEAD